MCAFFCEFLCAFLCAFSFAFFRVFVCIPVCIPPSFTTRKNHQSCSIMHTHEFHKILRHRVFVTFICFISLSHFFVIFLCYISLFNFFVIFLCFISLLYFFVSFLCFIFCMLQFFVIPHHSQIQALAWNQYFLPKFPINYSSDSLPSFSSLSPPSPRWTSNFLI